MPTAAELEAAKSWEEMLIADVRANGGRPSGGPLKGHPIGILYSIGAKSGEQRRSIVTTSRDGDAYVIAGTAGGSPTTPAWVANLRANPRATLEAEGQTFEVDAEVFDAGAEHDRLWAGHVEQLPWFGDDPAQVEGIRAIPVIRMTRARS